MRVGTIVLGIVLLASQVQAQTIAPTMVISDTVGRLSANPAPEHNATFGTPPVPVVSSYVVDFFLRTAVTNFATCATMPTAPAFSADAGKPTPDAQNRIALGVLKVLWPAMPPNTEYFACARAVGPGGSSPRTNVGVNATNNPVPFGFPGAPGAPAGATVAP